MRHIRIGRLHLRRDMPTVRADHVSSGFGALPILPILPILPSFSNEIRGSMQAGEQVLTKQTAGACDGYVLCGHGVSQLS